MTGLALERPVATIAWDLRTAWAAGWRIAVSLERSDRDRLEGCVSHVSATAAFVTVAGVHVPLDRVLAVHRPSRLGDSSWRSGRWSRERRVAPQPDSLFA